MVWRIGNSGDHFDNNRGAERLPSRPRLAAHTPSHVVALSPSTLP